MTFTLRLSDSENPQLRSQASVVSRHSSLGAARLAFFRLYVAAERQGYHCEAFIWDEERNSLASGSAGARQE